MRDRLATLTGYLRAAPYVAVIAVLLLPSVVAAGVARLIVGPDPDPGARGNAGD